MADVCIPAGAGGTAFGELVMPSGRIEVKTYTLRGRGILVFGYGGYSPLILCGDTKKEFGFSTSSDGYATGSYDGVTLTLEKTEDFIQGKTLRYILFK